MAESVIGQPTLFPNFDVTASARPEHYSETRYREREFSYAGNPTVRPLGRTALIKSFSRFVTSYTGETKTTYQFALRQRLQESSTVHIIQHESIDGTIEESRQTRDNTDVFDFGLEILADAEAFDSRGARKLLECPFLVQYHAMDMTLTMSYATHLMDDEYADAAFEMLINHMSREEVFTTQQARLSVLNHSSIEVPSDRDSHDDWALLHPGFMKSVDQYPDRHALDYRSETKQFTLTYRQLDYITTALAHRLRDSLSHTPRAIVPAYMDVTPAFYISWLAVIKAGFAFCPLPINGPAIQLQNIVEEICATLVLTNGPMLCGCPWDAWYCDDDELSACLDVNDFILAYLQTPSQSQNQPLPPVSETDLAYVLYNSTSSGTPHGITMSHQAAANSISSLSRHIPSYMSKRGYRWLQTSAPTFESCILEIFTTWWTGGTLCAVPLTDLNNMTQAINRVSANICTATSSMVASLDSARTPSLRQLWCLGPTFSSSLIGYLTRETACSPYTGLRLLKLYAAPGCGIHATIIPASPATRDSIIGTPLPTTSVILLDPQTKKAVPLGAAGELYIGGPSLCSGFLDRPDLDSQHFLQSGVYGRLYKTGDFARVVKDRAGVYMIELTRCGVEGRDEEGEKEADEASVGEGSVASMVDSFTEAEEEKEVDVSEANVLSLVGKMYA